MKEDKFINIIKNILPSSAKYIGDDTAYIPEKDLILTQDTLIEDVHFRMSTISPYDLGIKSIAVNLSDIAASGGIPAYILISLSLPEHIEENFIEEFYRGVNSICERYKVSVVGGDLTRAEKVTISVAAVGFGDGVQSSRRSFAKDGDIVIVTGEFGSSRAGLWILEEGLCNSAKIKNIGDNITGKFVKAHINPIPRLEEGRIIARTCSTPPAMMDASDGLADALYKISLFSNVSMQINYKDIPVNEDLNFITDMARENPFKWVFYGGEDYQLIATVSQECFKKLKQQNVPVKVIGKVISIKDEPAVYVEYEEKTIKINSSAIDAEIFKHFD